MIHWGATEYRLHITHEETKALKGSDLVEVTQPPSRRTWTKTMSLWGQLLASVHDTGVPRGALWADPALHGWPGRVVGIWWGKRANMMWYGNCLFTGWLSLIFPRSVLVLGMRTGPHTHNWSGQSGDEGHVTDSMVVTWRTEREGHKETGQKGWGEQCAERQDSRGEQRDKPNERETRRNEGVEIWTQMSAKLFAYAWLSCDVFDSWLWTPKNTF